MALLLEVCNVTRRFGGLIALDDVSFSIDKGGIVGLIGPNGAGKSTMFNVISGFLAPTGGRIIYKGEDISGLKPHRIARKGIIRTFQSNVLFPKLSVLENVLIGGHLMSNLRKGLLSSSLVPRSEIERANEIIELTSLARLRGERAGDLPHGFQRMLAVAIGLSGEPELLLLDEPVTGMNLDEIKEVTELIRAVQSSKKVAVLIVEHDMKTVMNLCERIVVINFGKKLAEGSPNEVRSNKDVIEAYLGSENAFDQ
jgi:branched-chain amino acid transport system ATP-binding protein